MPKQNAFRVREALELIKRLEDELDRERKGFIFYRDFKKYIAKRFGSDKTTIRKYLDILELFEFAHRDPIDYEIIKITYKNSPEYKNLTENKLDKWGD